MLDRFMLIVEGRLCSVLRKREFPSVKLQQEIAVAKVKCIELSISLCHALKQEVGSFALMAGTGFEQMDFLQCCKFAEGDSRILMQKMVRDIMSQGPRTESERRYSEKLKNGIKDSVATGATKKAAWDMCWELVYELAEAHMIGIMNETLGQTSKL